MDTALLLIDKSLEFSRLVGWVILAQIIHFGLCYGLTCVLYYHSATILDFIHATDYRQELYHKQIHRIASRPMAVPGIHVHEMRNLLTLMKLWENRSCHKEDGYKNHGDTMTRLRSFLYAMECLDLTNKIYGLKDLSSHLNLVTQGVIRSLLLKFIDRMKTWQLVEFSYIFQVTLPYISTRRAIEPDNVKSMVADIVAAAIRLDSRHRLSGIHFRQWESNEDVRNLIHRIEEFSRDIQPIVKRIQKNANLPDFGRVAVVSCWKLGGLLAPYEEIELRPENPPIDSKLKRRAGRQIDERMLSGPYCMERVDVDDVDENGAYRGIYKLCVTRTMKDKTETLYRTGWLIDYSTVVIAAYVLCSPSDESYASEVKVQVGVTKGSRNVEMRWGHFIAMYWGFYAVENRQNNIAMIKLESPFHKVVPILYVKAPLVETESSFLRVVGYPGKCGGTGRYQGKIMHVSQGAHAEGWDLNATKYILRHRLDTDIGHSGCPLLKVGKDVRFEAIAIHAGDDGGVDQGWNEAAPLGHNGNDIKAFAEALRIMEDGDNARHSPGSQIEEVQDKIPGLKKVTIPLHK